MLFTRGIYVEGNNFVTRLLLCVTDQQSNNTKIQRGIIYKEQQI